MKNGNPHDGGIQNSLINLENIEMKASDTIQGDVIKWGGKTATVFTRDPFVHNHSSVLVDIQRESRNYFDTISLDLEVTLVSRGQNSVIKSGN